MPADRPPSAPSAPSAVPLPPAWHPSAPAPWPAPSPAVPVRRAAWVPRSIVGLVAAAAGFVEISFWSSRRVDGVVVACSYTNLAPWVFGPLAIVCGVVASGRVLVRGAGRGCGPACAEPGLAARLGGDRWWACSTLATAGTRRLDLLSQSPC